MIPFNLNDYIEVQLTDRGRELHKENYKRLFTGYMIEKYPYAPVKEDADGWSRWQAWDFMSAFGPYMGNGMNVPASTQIRIITDQKPTQ